MIIDKINQNIKDLNYWNAPLGSFKYRQEYLDNPFTFVAADNCDIKVEIELHEGEYKLKMPVNQLYTVNEIAVLCHVTRSIGSALKVINSMYITLKAVNKLNKTS